MVQKRVLGVIGLGHVGAHVAYALAIQGILTEHADYCSLYISLLNYYIILHTVVFKCRPDLLLTIA